MEVDPLKIGAGFSAAVAVAVEHHHRQLEVPLTVEAALGASETGSGHRTTGRFLPLPLRGFTLTVGRL